MPAPLPKVVPAGAAAAEVTAFAGTAVAGWPAGPPPDRRGRRGQGSPAGGPRWIGEGRAAGWSAASAAAAGWDSGKEAAAAGRVRVGLRSPGAHPRRGMRGRGGHRRADWFDRYRCCKKEQFRKSTV